MKRFLPEVVWALIFSAVMVVWLALERFAGLHGEHIEHHATVSALFALPAIVVYVLALRSRRLKPEAVLGWWPAFAFGLRMTVLIALLSPAVQWLIHTVITPDYFSNVADYAVATGELTAQQAAAQFSLNGYMIQGVVGALVMGIVTSAIVAIFQRKPKVPA